MARNTVTEQFRQSATEEQWKQLVSDHDTLSKEQFEEKKHLYQCFIFDSYIPDNKDL